MYPRAKLVRKLKTTSDLHFPNPNFCANTTERVQNSASIWLSCNPNYARLSEA